MILTLAAWNRPSYTRQVLTGLASCRGCTDVSLHVFLEPGCPDVLDILTASWPFTVTLIINPARRGCAMNTYDALSDGFSMGHDFIVHLEDDTVPAPGALEYFAWASHTYATDPSIFTVTAYHKYHDGHVPHDSWHAVSREQWFTPWMWGTWANRWEEIGPNWIDHRERRKEWDEHINHCIRGDRYQVYPLLARSQNIGAENGCHVPNAAWHRENQFNEEWEGKYDVPSAPFHDISPQAG